MMLLLMGMMMLIIISNSKETEFSVGQCGQKSYPL